MDADVVLGQPDFTSSSSGTSKNKMNAPYIVFTVNQKMMVSDYGNNRVLIWNKIPTTNDTPPDVVLGQSDFTSGGAGTTQQNLSRPGGIASDGTKLMITDYANHRVMIWNSIPTVNFTPADVVLGQADFTSAVLATSRTGMIRPWGAFCDGKRLFISEEGNHRVLIYNTVPQSNNAPADVVLGQENFTSNTAGVSRSRMREPYGIYSDGKRLYIGDHLNNRILIWNTIPVVNFAPADSVLGQPDFESAATGLSRDRFNYPADIASDGNRFFVSEYTNRRLLIWNQIPEKNTDLPDFVLGQTDFNSNLNRVTRNLISGGFGVSTDGKNLILSDVDSHRILIFNLFKGSNIKLGPQFEQGKGVLGKVFWDHNGNGFQDKNEKGMEGVKVVSDTGIYAITDEDGKYHFPYLETGQRVLKIDTDTLPEDAAMTTDNPYKVVVTEGVLSKVSFGVKRMEGLKTSGEKAVSTASPSNILLKVSVAQESSQLKPRLGVTVEMGKEKQEGKLVFTIDCNYFLFIKRSELKIYDQDQKLVKTIELPQPVPLYYEFPVEELIPLLREEENQSRFYYQVSVYDKQGAEDRTSIGFHQFTRYQVP